MLTLESVEGRPELRFQVRDTGVGISPEAKGRLFQAFSPSTSRS